MKKKILILITECNRPVYQDKLITLINYCCDNSLIPKVFVYDKNQESKIIRTIILERIKKVFIIDGRYDEKFLDMIYKHSKIYSFDSSPLQNLSKYNVVEIDDLKLNLSNRNNAELSFLLIKDLALSDEKFYDECNKIYSILKNKFRKNFKIYIMGSSVKFDFEYININFFKLKVHNDYYNKLTNIFMFYNIIKKLNPLLYTVYICNCELKDASYVHMIEFLKNRTFYNYSYIGDINIDFFNNEMIILDEKEKFLTNINGFYSLPIENKFIFSSFENNRYSCNPKFLSEYIIDNKLNYKVVWIFNDISIPIVSELEKKGIKCVKFKSLEYYREIITSKYIITNQRMNFDFIKREGQIYIQTWHGDIALKEIEKKCRDVLTPEWINIAKKDCYMTDYNICGSDYGYNMISNSFWYKHPILKIGTFRNDIFFMSDEKIDDIRKKYGFSKEYFYVLYAPTFRNNSDYNYILDFDAIRTSFEKKNKKQVKIIIKLHPNVRVDLSQYKSDYLIFMNECDIQELFVIVDSLITDYSSVMMDYIFSKKPCFLCLKDYQEYISNNRSLTFDLNKLPFIVSYDEAELCDKIESFNLDNYKRSVVQFLEKNGSFEIGESCKKFIEIIENK